MALIDWIILIGCLLAVMIYGVYISRNKKDLKGYFLDNNSMPWYLVLLSIMGTQASAVTYLSGPGQAYADGLRFVQYYFGLPLAMIVIARYFVPVFMRMQVVTPYEFLEKRFGLSTRILTSVLFLLSRGLSTGISIFAPAIVFSSLLGWDIFLTNILMGGLLIIYTLSGGAGAVAQTQKIQMSVVFITLILVFVIIVNLLPDNMNFMQAMDVAAENNKLNILTTGFTENGFDWNDKYNIFSGVIGGFFLALSYFGTDHSQVGRYITAKSEQESKRGLLMNGIVKIPMQYFIFIIGILVFVFYLKSTAPVYFNGVFKNQALQTAYAPDLNATESAFTMARESRNTLTMDSLRNEYKSLLGKALPGKDISDTNYIFLQFSLDHLPKGLVGILLAMIILSAWGSIAAALNSLAACSVNDFHNRLFEKPKDKSNDLFLSKAYTLGWGIFCIVVAMFANRIGTSLIEGVNILGSLFYGVILGIFLVAFFIRSIGGRAVFFAALLAEFGVILIYKLNLISFLWLNVIGALLVIVLASVIQFMLSLSRK